MRWSWYLATFDRIILILIKSPINFEDFDVHASRLECHDIACRYPNETLTVARSESRRALADIAPDKHLCVGNTEPSACALTLPRDRSPRSGRHPKCIFCCSVMNNVVGWVLTLTLTVRSLYECVKEYLDGNLAQKFNLRSITFYTSRTLSTFVKRKGSSEPRDDHKVNSTMWSHWLLAVRPPLLTSNTSTRNFSNEYPDVIVINSEIDDFPCQ